MMKTIIFLFSFVLSSCIVLNTNKSVMKNQNIYCYTNFETGQKAYLIVEQDGENQYATLSGFTNNDDGEVVFYKTNKLLIILSSEYIKFRTNKFIFSKNEISLEQLLGEKEITRLSEDKTPKRFSFTMNYFGEMIDDQINLQSSSDIDDSAGSVKLIFKRNEN